MQFKIGNTIIDRVEEFRQAIPIAALTQDAAFVERHLAPFPKGFFEPERQTFEFCAQTWIIRTDELTIVVDPCNGNGRVRPGSPLFTGLNTPWLERFVATGVSPGDVDIVFCTHLHCDHCGWNTYQRDGRWVPTFPRARYLFLHQEYLRWKPKVDRSSDPSHPRYDEYNENVFEESVRPIFEAGLAQLISAPYRISSELLVEAAPGHTLGHAMLQLYSEGVRAYFVGDVLHHPAQILNPELHLPGCDDLEQAIATRRSMFARARSEGAFLFPAHFAEPHHGRVIKSELGFGFAVGGAMTVT